MARRSRRTPANGNGQPVRRARRRRAKDGAGGLESVSTIALPPFGMGKASFLRTTAPVLLTKTGTDPNQSVTFTLADLPGYTDFTSLYDMYRIVRVDYHMIGIFSGVVTTKVYITSDYDGGAVASLSDICQHRHVERLLKQDMPELTFSVRPRVSSAVNATAGSVLSGVTSPWLDLASPTVVYYGISWALLNYNTGASGLNIYTSATFHFECCAVR